MPRKKATLAMDPAAKREPTRRKSDAREKILRAAERLFAAHGFEGCSLRTIAATAKVNQGMIHYFFKSKENLFLETYLCSGLPLVEERLHLLDTEESVMQGKAIALERLIELFLMPAIKLAMRGPSGRSFLRMQSRLQQDASPVGAKLRSLLYDQSTRRYFDAFRRSLPDQSVKEASWRFTFMLGTYQYALSSTGRLDYISGGLCSSKDYTEALRQMIPYIAAGMRAPSPSNARAQTVKRS